MIFHSLDFLVFLARRPGGLLGLCPRAGGMRCSFPASVIFYGFVHPWFLLPFATTTIIDYFVARGIETHPDAQKAARRASAW